MRYGSDERGIARTVDGDEIEILDLDFKDLSGAFRSGVRRADLDACAAREVIPPTDLRLRAPVPCPSALWLIGANYESHRREVEDVALSPSEWPLVLLMPSAAVSGPMESIVLPWRAPDQVDYEGEVVAVIGETAKDVEEDAAWDYIFGLTAGNDVSARDVQFGRYLDDDPDHTKGKGFDTFKPIGPWIATPDEYDNPADVGLRTWVDGELRQDARTSDLVFSVASCVAFISTFTTLRPGDVIFTGTPAGVGINRIGDHSPPFSGARARVKPAIGEWASTLEGDWLRPGSRVRVEVERAGAIENVVADQDFQREAVSRGVRA